MNTKRTVGVVVAMGVLAACGKDDVPLPTAPLQVTVPSFAGTYSSNTMWLAQFERLSDGWRSSYTCSGSLTFSQEAAFNEAPLKGFAVVGSPCPPVSFQLTGTVRADGHILLTGDGPRPTSCTAQSVAYTGQITNRLLSSRGSATLSCSGDVAGPLRFDFIVSAFRNN